MKANLKNNFLFMVILSQSDSYSEMQPVKISNFCYNCKSLTGLIKVNNNYSNLIGPLLK